MKNAALCTKRTDCSVMYPWVVTIIASLFFFYEFALNNIFNALEEPLRSVYHLDGETMGWISSLYFYVNMALLIPAALMLDRFSPRLLIVLAMLICATGTVLLGAVHGLGFVILSRILMGIGGGFSFVGCIRIAVNWLQSHQLARATSLTVAMGMFGGFVVQTPFEWLIAQVGWQQAVVDFGIFGYFLMFIIACVVRDAPKSHLALKQERHAALSEIGLLKSVGMVFGKTQNWACAIFASMINLPIYIFGALWGMPYLIYVNKLSNIDAASAVGMIFIGTLLGAILMGMISDFIRRRQLPMLAGVITSIMILGVILKWHQATCFELCLLMFFLGVSTSVQALSYPTVAESNSPMIASTATSILSMSFMLVAGIAQPLFGKILAIGWDGQMKNGAPFYRPESYQLAMNILPIAFLISLVAVLMIKETYAKPVV